MYYFNTFRHSSSDTGANGTCEENQIFHIPAIKKEKKNTNAKINMTSNDTLCTNSNGNSIPSYGYTSENYLTSVKNKVHNEDKLQKRKNHAEAQRRYREKKRKEADDLYRAHQREKQAAAQRRYREKKKKEGIDLYDVHKREKNAQAQKRYRERKKKEINDLYHVHIRKRNAEACKRYRSRKKIKKEDLHKSDQVDIEIAVKRHSSNHAEGNENTKSNDTLCINGSDNSISSCGYTTENYLTPVNNKSHNEYKLQKRKNHAEAQRRYREKKKKERPGIRSVQMKGMELPNDPLSDAEFTKILKSKIEFENLKLENIYNADESAILWRLLMACTLPLRLEAEASGRKGSRDRVTALFCANASGSHQIPLLMIGTSKTPQCLNNLITKNSEDLRLTNLESLGVIYTYQANAWMDKSIFLLWYKDEFIPRVLEHQRKHGITGKVLLLLDNAPSHPSLDELNAINENFEVVYLPHNMKALILPMDQGLIATTKKLYKKNLLRRLLLSENSEEATKFLKELNLWDCFGMLSVAWDDVESSSLQKAWKPLLGINIKLEEEEKDPLSIDNTVVSQPEVPTDLISFPHEICDHVSELLSGSDYSVKKSKEFLLKWFENDHNDNDCGWESSSGSDIVNIVTTGRLESEIVTKIENSETVFNNPDIANIVTTGSSESKIVTKIENSETVFNNPDIVTNGRLESEIVTKIENSETIFENPKLIEITSSEGVPEVITKIENSETMFANPESIEVSSSEAFVCLMKLKIWMKREAKCLPKLLDYLREMENLINKRAKHEISQNKVYIPR